MSRRRHSAEQIITALREAEVVLANGKTVAIVSRELGISEQTSYRWRKELGGMKVDQAQRLKELEKENGHNESFNGKLRDEFLDGEIFYPLPEAVVLIEQWRRLYNTVRPHVGCGGLPPAPETVKPSSWFLRMPQLHGPPMAEGLP
jgi:putative transposase